MKLIMSVMALVMVSTVALADTVTAKHGQCQKHSFSVGMEFPDKTFISLGGENNDNLNITKTAQDISKATGISEPVAIDHVKAIIKAISIFRLNPSISLTDLSSQSGGESHVFFIRHWCLDDNVVEKKYPRTIGYPLREESRATIWAKTSDNPKTN